MTEEDYFRKNYPDYCYGDRLLSPHWDFFQDGVEFGERQSEKKIADLEKENAELKETVIKMNNVITETFSNLTKAKELLGDWLQIAHKNHARCYGFVKDTEQFLEKVK